MIGTMIVTVAAGCAFFHCRESVPFFLSSYLFFCNFCAVTQLHVFSHPVLRLHGGGSVKGIYFLCLKIHWDHPAAVGYASFRPL